MILISRTQELLFSLWGDESISGEVSEVLLKGEVRI